MIIALLLLVISGGLGGYLIRRIQTHQNGLELAGLLLSGLVMFGCLAKLLGWKLFGFVAVVCVTVFLFRQWKKDQLWDWRILSGCAALLVGIALCGIARGCLASREVRSAAKARVNTETKYAESCWLALGTYLAQGFPNQGVLVLEYSWMAKNPQYRELMCRAIEKGGGGRLGAVAHETVAGALTWDTYKALVGLHPDARVVISAPGMPTRETRARPTGGTATPSASLIVLTEIGLHGDVLKAILSGEVNAAVVDCRNRTGIASLSGVKLLSTPYGETFHERYVLLDTASIEPPPKGRQSARILR